MEATSLSTNQIINYYPNIDKDGDISSILDDNLNQIFLDAGLSSINNLGNTNKYWGNRLSGVWKFMFENTAPKMYLEPAVTNVYNFENLSFKDRFKLSYSKLSPSEEDIFLFLKNLENANVYGCRPAARYFESEITQLPTINEREFLPTLEDILDMTFKTLPIIKKYRENPEKVYTYQYFRIRTINLTGEQLANGIEALIKKIDTLIEFHPLTLKIKDKVQ
jgi:hypothetical protein